MGEGRIDRPPRGWVRGAAQAKPTIEERKIARSITRGLCSDGYVSNEHIPYVAECIAEILANHKARKQDKMRK